jgi:hypothetical protein
MNVVAGRRNAPRRLVPCARRQQVSVAGFVVRNFSVEVAQRRGPKLDAIEVTLQLLQRLEEITNDPVFGGFRHGWSALVVQGPLLFHLG